MAAIDPSRPRRRFSVLVLIGTCSFVAACGGYSYSARNRLVVTRARPQMYAIEDGYLLGIASSVLPRIVGDTLESRAYHIDVFGDRWYAVQLGDSEMFVSGKDVMALDDHLLDRMHYRFTLAGDSAVLAWNRALHYVHRESHATPVTITDSTIATGSLIDSLATGFSVSRRSRGDRIEFDLGSSALRRPFDQNAAVMRLAFYMHAGRPYR